MSGPILGDLSQHLFLRRQTAASRGEVTALSNALATGLVSDRARHLGGQTAPLAAIEASLQRLATYDQTIAGAATRADAMQSVLARVDGAAQSARADLLQALSGGATALDAAAVSGRAAFEDAVNALNTRIGDRSLFSGTATDRPALLDPDDLLAAAKAAFAPATEPAAIATALDAWFADPAGFTASAFLGSSATAEIKLADDITLSLPVTAADPDLHGTLKGLVLAALLGETGFARDRVAQTALASLAGAALTAAGDGRTAAAGRLGLVQERIATAETRNGAEATALGIARADLIAVDGYDTASRLAEAESRLQTIYTLTARLSSLSLVNFLR